ncbi:efflux RND transporter periplasmic adaptor subunit [Arenicellales bacterium IMCC55707]
MKRQIFSVIGIAVFAFAGHQIWQHSFSSEEVNKRPDRKANRIVMVESASVEIKSLDQIIEAVGTTKALRSIEITPLSSGRVEETYLSMRAPVKAGSLLLKLDSVVEEADVMEAKAKLEEASRALQRSDTLQQSNGMSEAAIDGLRAQSKIALAALKRAQKNLDDRSIRAPFNGLISLSSIEKGSRIKEGDVIATLDDLTQVVVEFSVPENLYGMLSLGNTIRAHAAAFPTRNFVGEIVAIDSRIESTSRSFKVRAVIDNPDLALPAGMFIHVSIVADNQEALVIPEEAVITEVGEQFVFLLTPGDDPDIFQIEKRRVSLGRRTYGLVEITDGLSEREEVVTRGLQKVRHKSSVKKIEPNTDASLDTEE